MKKLIRVAAIGLLLVGAVFAAAQAEESGLTGLKIRAGFNVDFSHRRSVKEWHAIEWRGTMLNQRGEASKRLDATHIFLRDLETDKDERGDVPSFLFNFISGTGSVSGPYVDLLGMNEFSLIKLPLSPFRSVTQLSGRLDGKLIRAGIGLENTPLHFFSKDLGIANWLVLGAQAKGEWAKDGFGENRISPAATYRAFIGQSYGWKPNLANAPFKIDGLLPQAILASEKPKSEKLEELLAILDNLGAAIVKAAPGAQSSPLNAFIYTRYNERKEEPENSEYKDYDAYVAFIQDAYVRFVKSSTLEPTNALWLESSGWYDFGSKVSGDRFKPAVAFIASHWWNERGSKIRSEVQLKFEYGYDPATPSDRVSRLSLIFGFNF